MRLGLGVVLAQYYSDAISNNVKRRLEQKLRDGEWTGSAPFGYSNVDKPDGHKWVEVDDFEASIVKTAYELYATGSYSIKLIRQKLLTDYAIDLSNSQLHRILNNPFYIGEMRIKGELYPHKYDRIISEELFEQVKAVREGYSIKPTRWAGLPYDYRGLISCADCGCRITFEKKKAKYVYGHCTQYKGKHGAAYVIEDDFTKQLETVFEKIHMPEKDFNEVSQLFRQSYETDKQKRDNNLSRIDAEIEKYTKRIDRVYEDYADVTITKDLYARKTKEYTKASKALTKKRNTFELNQEERFNAVNRLLMLARNAPKLFEKATPVAKRSLINMVLSNLELKGDLLRWILNKPFDTMALCAENGNWLGMRDSNPTNILPS
jgi:hypothetical protein